MRVIYDESGTIKKAGKYAKEFLESESEQYIASKISAYAKRSPLEFVAECYARLMHGEKLPDEVMALYKKYEGPLVP